MEITIREIDENDYLSVLSLWKKELGYPLVNAENIALHYNRVKTDECYKTFVALLDGEVVGFISSIQSYFVGFEVGILTIVGLAVKNEKQNKGIGAKLLRYIEDYARAKGLSQILLDCSVKRTGSHIFYQRNGYGKDGWCFDKRL